MSIEKGKELCELQVTGHQPCNAFWVVVKTDAGRLRHIPCQQPSDQPEFVKNDFSHRCALEPEGSNGRHHIVDYPDCPGDDNDDSIERKGRVKYIKESIDMMLKGIAYWKRMERHIKEQTAKETAETALNFLKGLGIGAFTTFL